AVPAVEESGRTMSAISSPTHKFFGLMPAVPYLRISDLPKSFGSKRILKDINLDLAESRTLAIVGPSESGKTTLLRQIARFQAPDAGNIEFGERNVVNLWVPAHKREIGYVAQDEALFPHLNVAQNITFGLG